MVNEAGQAYDRFVQQCNDSTDALLAEKPWYVNSTDVVAKAKIRAYVFALGCDQSLGILTEAQYQERLAKIQRLAEAMKK